MICPNCHSEIRDGSRFCTKCGASIDPKQNQEQSVSDGKICPACGQENRPEAEFCTRCGASLKAEEVQEEKKESPLLCPLCGHENDPQSEYCTECGANLKHSARIESPIAKAFKKAGNKTSSGANNPIDSKKKMAVLAGAGALVVALCLGVFFLFNQNSSSSAVDKTLESMRQSTKDGGDEMIETVEEMPEEAKQQDLEEEEKEPKKNYTVISEDIPVFSSRPIYVGNGNYIYESNGKYGVINSQGKIMASDYDAYALRELSRPEKQMVDFVGYACVYNEPQETGIDAIELMPCDKNEVFPWVQEYAPRVIGADGTVKDLGSGTDNSSNNALYRNWQNSMVYTIVNESTYQSIGNQDVVPYYVYSEATQTLFGPYEAGEHAFFELKPRLVKNNYSCDSIFYNKEDGKYRIYNQDGTESYPELFDYAEPVSDDYMMVKSGDKTGLIDSDFNLVYIDDVSDITGADGSRAYGLIDGTWKLIEINPSDKEEQEQSEPESSSVSDGISQLEEFIEQKGYAKDTGSLSNLGYVIEDMNNDGTKELLICSDDGSSFFTTWTYVLNNGAVKLVDKRYGYGMFRLSQDRKQVLTSPEVRPNHNVAVVPFETLTSTGYTQNFSIGLDSGKYYYWGQDNQPVPFTEEQYDSLLGTPINLPFEPLE